MHYRIALFCFAMCLITSSIARSEQAVQALTWNGFAVIEDIYNFSGGIESGSVFDGAGQLRGVYDTEIAKLWSGGQFTFGALAFAQTHNQTAYTGAIQSPSNYSANNNQIRPYLSYQQKINTVIARVGILDLNDYFNVTETANELLNASFGISPILTVNSQTASYPWPAYAVMLGVDKDNVGAQLGVFQGNPQHLGTVFNNGQMVIGEISGNIKPTGRKDSLDFILKIGAWSYQQSNPNIGNNNNGIYVIAESTWQNKESQQHGIFLQFGADPQNVNPIPYSLGAGCTANAIFQSRPKDILSLGFTRVWVNGAAQETVFEVTYSILFTDKLKLNPDLQYVLKPAGIYPNAWVGIIRLTYTI